MVNTSIIDSNNVSKNIPAGSHSGDFGSEYSNKEGIVYIVKFVTESNIWDQHSLADRIHNLKIFDTEVVKGTSVFDTMNDQYRNTLVLKNEFR